MTRETWCASERKRWTACWQVDETRKLQLTTK
jgi:hypothetical protein